MKVLAIGDVCGKAGCEAVLEKLPLLKSKYGVNLTIINGENSAEGNGILPSSAEILFSAGADVITGGNHSLRRREIFDYLEEKDNIIRPANMPASIPGKGICFVDLGYTTVAVISLLGVINLDNMACPFETADKMIELAKSQGAKTILIDFHAEATSEKRALGFYLDGKITALFGTHTHVQTADEQILPGGTGYITDIGMTGVKQSVLGIETGIIIDRLKNKICNKFLNATGETELCGILMEIDHKTGKLVKIERVCC